MELIEILKAIFLGMVQGITEWLPISSTGHLLLVNEFLHLQFSPDFVSSFTTIIQFGSILAVVLLYFHKLNPFSPKKTAAQKRETFSLWLKVLVGAIPAGIVGLLFEEKIDALFYNSTTIAITLILYGIFFIILENRRREAKIGDFSQLSYRTALLIGVFQILALVPGTSRSGATILGAILLGCARPVAAEYSVFLAVPMRFGASFLKIVKYGGAFSGAEWGILLIGVLTAFIVSVFAIKFLMNYIRKHDFKAFGYYRIVLGVLVLLYFFIF